MSPSAPSLPPLDQWWSRTFTGVWADACRTWTSRSAELCSRDPLAGWKASGPKWLWTRIELKLKPEKRNPNFNFKLTSQRPERVRRLVSSSRGRVSLHLKVCKLHIISHLDLNQFSVFTSVSFFLSTVLCKVPCFQMSFFVFVFSFHFSVALSFIPSFYSVFSFASELLRAEGGEDLRPRAKEEGRFWDVPENSEVRGGGGSCIVTPPEHTELRGLKS